MITNKKGEGRAEQEAIDYINQVFGKVKQRDPHETEFLQATKMLFDSLIPVFVKNRTYIEHNILERIIEPERIITFRVPWIDDEGKAQVNRGYRVQYNSALGPYKGGIRFHPTVNLSVMKFLSLTQIFKNSLTGQPIGGGKGGADFDPKGKSENEIMRFCQSYMTELYRHIGPDIDVPAGDIGVGRREIGYMFGQYKRLKGIYEAGVLTGKGQNYGGSLGRTEATGYGTIYFVEEMLKEKRQSLKNMTVITSGSGNVAIYAMEKAIQLGAKVVACSDSNGYIYDKNGLSLQTIKRIKISEGGRIKEYVDTHPEAEYFDNCSDIWSVPCDIALPCATQNEIDLAAAQMLIENDVKVVAEGANMPCTSEAIEAFLENDIMFGPAQAVNAGGVACSALEMAQNSSRLRWTFEQVNQHLKLIMKEIYWNVVNAANEYGHPGNLVVGANIAGFTKVADTMIEHGVV
ncbi:MAG TPA: NADP-specific glutamate dehydrogenase [Pseudogracilibacillus sp.]|nr:NADP-specific glutamate dehydrogenase [Pseudogracilibacillus sp.]HZW68581.1 NADP-specific glutamate dehydrogenase [Pseudogracilibacillus sp.]